ncbi:energy transducer TonB [Longimicrobium sp.]|uniref:energy transducer TonB n=1 Tax=Longimicrobium sp. TaxID=2029185 RepID=UPI003B3B0A9B
MFKVLTGEKKRRGITPATIIASIAAHLVLLGGLVYASTAEYEMVEDICLDCGVSLPEEPPPVYVEEQPKRTPAQPGKPLEKPAPADVLVVPRMDVVPIDPRAEKDGAQLVNPEDYRRDGRPGDIIGPRTTVEPTPLTGETVEPTPAGPMPASDAEVRPVLERTGLSRILERNYPAMLRDDRVSGRVVIEMVVDEEGVPVPGSARVIEASHPAFGEATLRVADRFRFRPARINGNAVAVVVTIPIVWTAN